MFPIKQRKSPVLAFLIEHIGRSSSCQVEVKTLRFIPGISAVRANENGNISLQKNPFGMGVVFDAGQLQVTNILQKQIEKHLLSMLRFERGKIGGFEFPRPAHPWCMLEFIFEDF